MFQKILRQSTLFCKSLLWLFIVYSAIVVALLLLLILVCRSCSCYMVVVWFLCCATFVVVVCCIVVLCGLLASIIPQIISDLIGSLVSTKTSFDPPARRQVDPDPPTDSEPEYYDASDHLQSSMSLGDHIGHQTLLAHRAPPPNFESGILRFGLHCLENLNISFYYDCQQHAIWNSQHLRTTSQLRLRIITDDGLQRIEQHTTSD